MATKPKAAPKNKKVPKVRIKVKTIDIQAKEWSDKTFGNTYFAGKVTVNKGTKTEKTFRFPTVSDMSYGYGSQYETAAFNTLSKNGYMSELNGDINHRRLTTIGVITRSFIERGCKKAEVKAV